MSVGLLKPDEEEAWKHYVAGHPAAHVYHTPAWRDTTAEGLGHAPFWIRSVDGDGRINGVLPLFLVKGLLGKRLVSVPMRDRGSVLADNHAVADELVNWARAFAKDQGCKKLEIRSTEPLPASDDVVASLALQRYWVNSWIDLTPGRDALWRQMSKKAGRQAVGRARTRGVTIELDDTQEGIDTFHRLFVRTRTSLGIPPYGLEFFRAIHQHMISPGHGQLYLLRKGDKPIHGLINLLFRDRMFAAYAAPQPEHRTDNPNELALWESMEWGCANGYTRLDLGADSPDQEGLIWFKKKLGAQSAPTFNYFSMPKGGKAPVMDSSSGGFSLARSVWSRFPLGLSRTLGAWVARQLD